MWVFATLVDGAISGYERFVAPLSAAEKQSFFADTCQLVALLGVKQSYLPASYDELCLYIEDMIASGKVVVSQRACKIAPFILAQTYPILKPLTLPPSRITVGLLPPLLREQYGYHFSSWEEKALSAFSAWTRRTVPFLPDQVRYVAPYRRARRLVQT
jgi:uncharacterized protein (DUF2236 family)